MNLPHWLHSVDNGKIGEARTRAILVNAFWILERSVDIEGADFIIQRKIYGRNLLDERAPRLGYVQSKFCQDSSTGIDIHADYVVDPEGAARNEFFLFVHTGGPGKETVYFLPATVIVGAFRKGPELFHSKMREIESLPEAKVQSTDYVLSLMDRQLAAADFRKNRLFYRSLALDDKDQEFPYDHDFTLPLANNWGNIVKNLEKLRARTKTLVADLESDVQTLQKALSTTDPIEFVRTFEYDRFYVLEDYFYRSKDYFDEDFYRTLMNHKKRVELLRTRGMLQSFLQLRSIVEDELLTRIRRFNRPEVDCFCVEISVDSGSLKATAIQDFECEMQKLPARATGGFSDYFGVVSTGLKFTIYFKRASLFHDADTAQRYPRYVSDEFEEALLEKLFGEAALYS